MNSAARAVDTSPAAIVAALAAECLRLPVSNVQRDVPLSRLGLDSLGCMELAARIEEVFGRPLPSDAIVEHATVQSLCAALDRESPAITSPFARMRADARLADDIIPRRTRGDASLGGARTILLTGATGFLGTALLRTVIEHTSARIVCLARSTAQEDAKSRVRRIADDQRLDPARIQIIDGDLSAPRIGLSDSTWNALAGTTDAILHAGASINWVSPYEALRAVNVEATRELLRLASAAGASFHFVSSLSVCFSTRAPRRVRESYDALDHIDGLHFGYAQTKAVAEALVLQAQRRGLRARIYRPGLISGDSRTGRFNRDDLLSALIAGCVRMKTAPDLDWTLDALPVDSVADAILRLSGGRTVTRHLSHPRPRHWRECALWMRLYGYPVRLIPYRDWIEQLRHDTAIDIDHPLRPLRSFFLDAVEDGLSIPELHQNLRRPQADASASLLRLSRAGGTIVPLDAELMNRYFTAFVRSGQLPPPTGAHNRATSQGAVGPAAIARELLEQAGLPARSLTVTQYGAEHSIISELTRWRSGTSTGVFRVGAGGRQYILKIKPHADDAIAVGGALADLCGASLGEAYARFGPALGLQSGHAREIAIYRDRDTTFLAHTPTVIAASENPASATWALLLEQVRPARSVTSRSDIDVAIPGMAALHARWYGRAAALRQQPWIGTIRSTSLVARMEPLWSALADHAAPIFGAAAGPALPLLHRELIARIETWRPPADALPHTLIHNDFNPRNFVLCRRGDGLRVCAFDWELATIGTPLRDLAELLCFVCPPNVTPAQLTRWIERHRKALSQATGPSIDPAAWRAAFGSALCELLIDRLAVHALVDRVKPQRYLSRVVRTWMSLYRLAGADAIAA